MRADLADPPPAPSWPAGIRTTTWTDADAPAVHALLVHAYAGGGGEVAPYATWRRELTGDGEFDPALCTLAWSGPELAGVALAWTSAFVKDLCVREGHRGRDLGAALLVHSLRLLRDRGASAAELKVERDNPSGAAALYRRRGFRVVEVIGASPEENRAGRFGEAPPPGMGREVDDACDGEAGRAER